MIESMGCQGEGRENLDKRNVVFASESLTRVAKRDLKALVAKRGGRKIFEKKNVVFEPESLQAWVAKRGAGQILMKGMSYLHLSH